LAGFLHDHKTHGPYLAPIESFEHGITAEEWYEVHVLSAGRDELEDVNSHLSMSHLNM